MNEEEISCGDDTLKLPSLTNTVSLSTPDGCRVKASLAVIYVHSYVVLVD